MRLQLTLEEINDSLLAAEYFFSLSGAIYKLMKFDLFAFPAYLREKGDELKKCRHWNFSFALKLRQPVVSRYIITMHTRRARPFVFIPLINGFIQKFDLCTVTGDIELIKSGFETGFGNLNSLGLGMADVVNSI